MTERARHHHYVPEAYLRGWSEDGNSVRAYRTLVPAPGYPEWEQRSVRGVAYHDDLYTSIEDGVESDAFERWLNDEIENPAADAIERVRRGRPLTRGHWKRLAVYAAALDLRTPASYLEQEQRTRETLPKLLDEFMRDLPERLRARQAAHADGAPPQLSTERNPFPIEVTTEVDPQTGQMVVRAEVTSGRALWLHNMRRQLTTIAAVLTKHRWTILHPYPGHEWITSDHPLLRLNWYGPDHDPPYDFGGGWGSPKSEILLPLSPTHLMYTIVGQRYEGARTLSLEMTLQFQRFFAERAHRWIIARHGVPEVAEWRPRNVDRDGFREENHAWGTWNELHGGAAEAGR